MEIITKLSDAILPELQIADEVWIAVALLNSKGLNFFTDNFQDNCTQHYLIGVDLPSEPLALWMLFESQLKTNLTVKLYTNQECYHPKLYLFRTGKRYKAFVGSANCTNGGLSDNIELTIAIENQEICKQLQLWFEELFKNSKSLTKNYLKTYQERYIARREKSQEEKRIAKQEKKLLNKESEAILAERNELINVLKNYRKSENYAAIPDNKKETIKELRLALDYPKFSNIDVDTFFSEKELGTIMGFNQPYIKQEIEKFSCLLTMLCDEKIDISNRYDRALKGDLKIAGAGGALISKVLTIHNPNRYFVKNGKSKNALKKYGLELPRGLSEGYQYKIMCGFLKKICVETDIENFAVLDEYLFREGDEN